MESVKIKDGTLVKYDNDRFYLTYEGDLIQKDIQVITCKFHLDEYESLYLWAWDNLPYVWSSKCWIPFKMCYYCGSVEEVQQYEDEEYF